MTDEIVQFGAGYIIQQSIINDCTLLVSSVIVRLSRNPWEICCDGPIWPFPGVSIEPKPGINFECLYFLLYYVVIRAVKRAGQVGVMYSAVSLSFGPVQHRTTESDEPGSITELICEMANVLLTLSMLSLQSQYLYTLAPM